jgi:hypothetical protein
MAKTKAKKKAQVKASGPGKRKAVPTSVRKSPIKVPGKVKLLSGGNPQIAKADGDAPVKAYIAAMPGWKSAVGKQLNQIIERCVPSLSKAVKWNSPFYADEKHFADYGWFLAFHVFTHFVRVTFFNGAALRPPPPGPSKMATTRYYDIREGGFDAAQFTAWVKQASAIPGWKP